MSPREIVLSEERVKLSETIRIDQIVPEFDLIDDVHADELGANMQLDDDGQLSRIVVRARFDEQGSRGRIVYDVIDGFHRTEGKRRTGDEEIDAEVLYGRSDEELFDQRILAASSVRAVQFPRIAEWVSKSYASTKFAKKKIPVERAFYIVAHGTRRPQGLQLSEKELDELYEYVQKKCGKWGRSISVVSDILQTVANADPKLVRKVRDKGGGKDRTGQITPERLKVVVNAFPGKENYGIQNALLEMILEYRMFSTSARLFIEDLLGKVNPKMSENQVIEIARSIFPTHLQAEERRNEKKKASRLTLADIDSPDDEVELPRASAQGSTEKKHETLYSSTSPTKRPPRDVNTNLALALENPQTIEELQWQIEGLKARIAELETSGNDPWWRGASYLSRQEQLFIERVMFKAEDIHEVGREFNLNTDQVMRVMISAFSKRRLHLEGLED